MVNKSILSILSLLLVLASGTFLFSTIEGDNYEGDNSNLDLFETTATVNKKQVDSLPSTKNHKEVSCNKTCFEDEQLKSVSSKKLIIEHSNNDLKKCEAENIRDFNANASLNFVFEQYNVVDITDSGKHVGREFSVTFDSFSATLTKVNEDKKVIPLSPLLEDLESRTISGGPAFPSVNLPVILSGQDLPVTQSIN